jgi:hemolysin activation/secretion protein
MINGNLRLSRNRRIQEMLLLVIFFVLFLLNLALTAAHAFSEETEPPEVGISSAGSQGAVLTIRRFVITGNTVFSLGTLRKELEDLRGEARTAANVEKARDRLEKFYRGNGYPAGRFDIPEQPVAGGFAYLRVSEGKAGNGDVTGSRRVPEQGIRQSLPAPTAGKKASSGNQGDTFPIRRFVISGNTVFSLDTLRKQTDDLRGLARASADGEKARDRLEKFYHDYGYPTSLVNIPEQSVEGGFVYLQVIEGRVGSATVTGNRWVADQTIRQQVPSLTAGEIVHIPTIKKELMAANSSPDLRVTPAMAPGKETGKMDVELKVEDRLPLHGSLEVNNRNSINTTDLRLNATLRYDDLWGLGHSISFQYQTSPQKTSEVQVFAGSYTVPAPWNRADRLVLYGVLSDSETGFGEGFKTLGNGSIIGLRYQKPLVPYGAYNHNLTLGFDYKDFREAQSLSTEITYLPFSVAYSASLADSTGVTQFNAALNFVFRGLVTDREEFFAKGGNRADVKGNYVCLTPGIERNQRLPAGMGLRIRLDGQLSDQPLISNEQYAAGGMENVRGYYESEASGDNALHISAELAAPDLAKKAGLGEKSQFIPYLFYEYAAVQVKQPSPGQTADFYLQGTGAGARGTVLGFLDYQVDGAFALHDAGSSPASTRKGDSRVMFKVKGEF